MATEVFVLRFTTPTINATHGAMDVLDAAGLTPEAVLHRHFAGEWGGQPDNAALNEQVMRNGEGRVISIFDDIPGGPLWVISYIGYGEGSYTTIMTPAEY